MESAAEAAEKAARFAEKFEQSNKDATLDEKLNAALKNLFYAAAPSAASSSNASQGAASSSTAQRPPPWRAPPPLEPWDSTSFDEMEDEQLQTPPLDPWDPSTPFDEMHDDQLGHAMHEALMETKMPQSDAASVPNEADATVKSEVVPKEEAEAHWDTWGDLDNEPVATDSAASFGGFRRTEQWRERPGHEAGGRYGDRGGGDNAKWHTARARARKYAKANNLHEKTYMREWYAENPKPNKATKTDGQQ